MAQPITIPARRVLLVEDQAAVRTLASATLEREGFDVLAVGTRAVDEREIVQQVFDEVSSARRSEVSRTPNI